MRHFCRNPPVEPPDPRHIRPASTGAADEEQPLGRNRSLNAVLRAHAQMCAGRLKRPSRRLGPGRAVQKQQQQQQQQQQQFAVRRRDGTPAPAIPAPSSQRNGGRFNSTRVARRPTMSRPMKPVPAAVAEPEPEPEPEPAPQPENAPEPEPTTMVLTSPLHHTTRQTRDHKEPRPHPRAPRHDGGGDDNDDDGAVARSAPRPTSPVRGAGARSTTPVRQRSVASGRDVAAAAATQMGSGVAARNRARRAARVEAREAEAMRRCVCHTVTLCPKPCLAGGAGAVVVLKRWVAA
jgi:hypothetical protein